MAFALKCHGQDAIAVGWRFIKPDTLDMLCMWCDIIIVMQKEFEKYVNPKYASKLRIVDVGPDRFGTPFHKELTQFLGSTVQQWSQKLFQI